MMGISDGVDGMNSSSGSSVGSLGGVHGGVGVGHQVLGGGSGEGHTGSQNQELHVAMCY